MGRVEDAQREAREAENEARAADAEAARAEKEHQKKRLEAEANPTPENIDAARDAALEANRALAEATRRRRAVTAAMNAVVDAQLAEIQAQIVAAQAATRAAAENPNGINIVTNSLFDWETKGDVSRLVTNNFRVQVAGTEQRTSLGFFQTFIAGAKVEVCLATKHGVIIPLDHKYIYGSNINQFGGVKMDIVLISKVDKIFGAKYEAHAGVKISKGPSTKTKEPEREIHRGRYASATDFLQSFLKKREETLAARNLNSKTRLARVTEITRVAGKTTQKIAKFLEKASTSMNSGQNFLSKTSGMTRLVSKGDCLMDGGGSQINLTGTAVIKGSGASITIDSSGIHSGDNLKLC